MSTDVCSKYIYSLGNRNTNKKHSSCSTPQCFADPKFLVYGKSYCKEHADKATDSLRLIATQCNKCNKDTSLAVPSIDWEIKYPSNKISMVGLIYVCYDCLKKRDKED